MKWQDKVQYKKTAKGIHCEKIKKFQVTDISRKKEKMKAIFKKTKLTFCKMIKYIKHRGKNL